MIHDVFGIVSLINDNLLFIFVYVVQKIRVRIKYLKKNLGGQGFQLNEYKGDPATKPQNEFEHEIPSVRIYETNGILYPLPPKTNVFSFDNC